jgi:large subunit ribosomal protein L28
MAMKCSNCGKGVMYGHNVSHSKRRTRKIFKPNLHQTRIILNGQSVRLKLCTKCQRMFKKIASINAEVTEEVHTQEADAPQEAPQAAAV